MSFSVFSAKARKYSPQGAARGEPSLPLGPAPTSSSGSALEGAARVG